MYPVMVWGSSEVAYGDPLDAVNTLGYRVVWVHDLEHEVLVLDDQRLVLADADLKREDVAAELTALLHDGLQAS